MAVEQAPKIDLTVAAELDVPGETTRQGRVFQVWFACLFIAVGVVVIRRPMAGTRLRQDDSYAEQVADWKRERLLVALGIGLMAPALLTWLVTHRRRRGGPHARGISVDVTESSELRLWGRGYGDRVALDGADVSERMVDVFTGRMGAWRQRRLRVRAARPLAGSLSTELELATLAEADDEALGLRLDGGEGDCVELSRPDFMAIRRLVMDRAGIEESAPPREPPEA